jgi:hypothetical protein
MFSTQQLVTDSSSIEESSGFNSLQHPQRDKVTSTRHIAIFLGKRGMGKTKQSDKYMTANPAK